MMEPLTYRPNSAADMLGISRSALYRLLALGELQAVKSGRNTLIPADCLKRYISGLHVVRPAARKPAIRRLSLPHNRSALRSGIAGVDPDWDA